MNWLEKILIVLFFLQLIAIGFLVSNFMEYNKEKQIEQSTIEGLKKQNAHERDSLNTVLAITKDSLNVAFHTIALARKESQEAHERTQRIIKRYEQIIFIRYSSDSARHRKLAELYNTYVIP